MEQSSQSSDIQQASQKVTICEQHQKPVEFYCNIHQSFHCSKCISSHIDCQVKGNFHPIEDLAEQFKLQLQFVEKKLKQSSEANEIQAKQLKEQISVLIGLKQKDQENIAEFFEDMKKSAEILKQTAIKQYELGFDKMIAKLELREEQLRQQSSLTIKTITNIQTLSQSVAQLPDPLHRTVQSVLSKAQLEAEEAELQSQKVTMSKVTVIEELTSLVNREQICSELGELSQEAMKVSRMVENFVKEKLCDVVEDEQLREESKQSETHFQETPEELKQKKMQQIEEMMGFDGLTTGLINIEEENRQLYVQLRYCSNQIYVYNVETEKFETYFLFTTEQYNIPFNIFHNCAIAIAKNHLVFLFGGEDPSNFDKSSNRAFCINLHKSTERNKVIIYELNEMQFPRSEFSVTSIGNSIYLVSGYNSNQQKDQRVIPKCEKFDLKTKKFYEMRDINYPRIYAGLVAYQNQSIYAFGGKNPKYMNIFVEKIEKYQINLNDWSVLKYHVGEAVDYQPTMRSACFKVTDNEILILGGSRDDEISAHYYIFDVKKLMMLKKSDKPLLKEPDEFVNQNDIVLRKKERTIYLMSANYVKKIYMIYYQEENTELVCVPIQDDID